MVHSILKFSEEVRAAREAGQPVVALESTFIAHGLPWPTNLETVCEAEAAVRAAAAVPATIAVVDGEIRVGASLLELERLARDSHVVKAGCRDLPWLIARRGTGATTVAGTLFIAHHAGIPTIATGGIGGVHRGASESWDVSADLIELARTPVSVVCSGPKSILDLPRTLEFLETHGVPVVGYATDELPAFLARSSGLRLDKRVDSPVQAADLIRVAKDLGITAGIVIANPAPAECALPADELNRMIDEATASAEAAAVHGKKLTPFLLNELRRLSGGRTLAVNRALIVCNARLAAGIARALREGASCRIR